MYRSRIIDSSYKIPFTISFCKKNITYCQNSILKSFIILFSRWPHVPNSVPILASTSFTLTTFNSSIFLPRNRLYWYDFPFEALTISPSIYILPLFQDLLIINNELNNPTFPSHTGISGNDVADYLAVSINKNLRCPIPTNPATDFFIPFKLKHNQSWGSKWASSVANFAMWYRYITSMIPSNIWFLNLFLSKHHIVQFSRLRLEHNLLPIHAFHLFLNHSPSRTHYNDVVRCNFNLIFREWWSLVSSRRNLLRGGCIKVLLNFLFSGSNIGLNNCVINCWILISSVLNSFNFRLIQFLDSTFSCYILLSSMFTC